MLTKEDAFTGTQIAYSILCDTKCWYFSHRISMEHTSDLVSIGKLIHETTFEREKKKEMIDNKICVDIIKRGEQIVLREINVLS